MNFIKMMSNDSTTDFSIFSGRSRKAGFNSVSEKSDENKKYISEKPFNKAEKTTETAKIINFKSLNSVNEEAVAKLESELETTKNNLLPIFPIVRYLKEKCLADKDFSELVMNDKKSLEKCFKYIEGEVRKALLSQNGWLDDNEVYAYAETYFITDEKIFEKIEEEKKTAEEKRRTEVAKKRKEQEEKRKKTAKKETSSVEKENLNSKEEQISLEM